MADTSTRSSHDRPPGLPEQQEETARSLAELTIDRQYGSGSFDPSLYATPNTQYSGNNIQQTQAFSGSLPPQLYDAHGFASGSQPYAPERFTSASTPFPPIFPAAGFVSDQSGAQWFQPPAYMQAATPAYLAPAAAQPMPFHDPAYAAAAHIEYLQRKITAEREEHRAAMQTLRENVSTCQKCARNPGYSSSRNRPGAARCEHARG